MMSFADRFNRPMGKFNLDTKDFKYRKLSECYSEFGADKVYTLGLVFINTKGSYGDSPVAGVREGFYVNLPKHLLDECREMISDDSVIADINAGLCGFTIYTYPSHGKQCYGVRWVDIQPENEGMPESPIPF